MKVLWLCNIMLPAFAAAEGLPFSNREGWLTGSFHRLVQEKVETGREEKLLELGVCVPVPASLAGCRKEIDGAVFYATRRIWTRRSIMTSIWCSGFRRF